jgi:hypothetical protein
VSIKDTHSELDAIPPLPPEILGQAFPGGFTLRDEANALAAYAFRNGPLETLHAGKSYTLLSDPSLSRITEDEMKELMIYASERLEDLLKLRESDPASYKHLVQAYALMYCRAWNR